MSDRGGMFARAIEWVKRVYTPERKVKSDFPWNEYWIRVGERPGRNDYWMAHAAVAASRSTCLKVGFGAEIVTPDGKVLVSDGYNGVPRGATNCLNRGYCIRKKLGIPHGERLETCIGVDAERNAVINAARNGIAIPPRSRMYVIGFSKVDGKPLCGRPRTISMGAILNSGIDEIYYLDKDGKLVMERACDLIWELNTNVEKYLGLTNENH